MVTAKDRLQNVNRAEITVEDYNCSGNTIMMDIEFDKGEHVYFLTVYRNVAAWYRNNICFTKKETGKFHQQSGNVLALTPWAVSYTHLDVYKRQLLWRFQFEGHLVTQDCKDYKDQFVH